MKNNVALFAIAPLLALVMVLGVACGDDDDSTGEGSPQVEATVQEEDGASNLEGETARLCADLEVLRTSISEFGDTLLSSDVTLVSLRVRLDEVMSSLQDVRTGVQAVREGGADDLEQSFNDLDEAISGLENEEGLLNVAASLLDAVSSLTADLAQLVSDLNCE